jgi:ferredoxin
MDMHAKPQDQLIFHLTGKRSGDGLEAIDAMALRPALLAPLRDLAAVRHDFPLVLTEHPQDPEFVRSLASLVDSVLQEMAPRGIAGERMRRHGLQLEVGIRRAVDAGATGTLAELWDQAAAEIGAREGETLEQVLQHAGGALPAEGQVLGCTAAMPAVLIRQAWQQAYRAKAMRFQLELSRLVQKLSDILRAVYSHSQAGRQPQSLRESLGAPHREAFDFEMLSRIVGKGVPRDELPPERRARLERTLAALESQTVYDFLGEAPSERYVFDNCAAAAQAFRERLPQLAALGKGMAVAELEVSGRYREAEHDLFFEAFDEAMLTADDLARFPDVLVCIPPDRNEAPENANLMELLSSGAPVKVLVQTADLLEDAALGSGRFAFGVRSARLATAAMGLGGMFVLQSAASNLYALRGRIAHGMACREPALFSIFAAGSQGMPPYLSAAAAMQSRAFPAFSYDAAAGANWAARFSLENNPLPDQDWSVETLDYSDTALQRAAESTAFTFADFVLGDARHAAHFARVPRARWNPQMLPLADWLKLGEADAAQHVPYLLAVDETDALQRVIVDARLAQATRRCLLLWHRLQEHGGIHDSHAERLLAREKAAWQAAQQPQPASAAPAARAPAGTAAGDEPAVTATHSRDEAWIDTARCPSCNECQLINDRMFGYDERKQAFIKDLGAGTYRQLVEAAESCQVAIIHPGAPLNPNEAGIEELLKRAEPFR